MMIFYFLFEDVALGNGDQKDRLRDDDRFPAGTYLVYKDGKMIKMAVKVREKVLIVNTI